MKKGLKLSLFAMILAAQLAAITRSQFVGSRYFSWAPFDTQTEYTLTVLDGDGDALSDEAVSSRYNLSAEGRDNRSPHHLFDVVRQYEVTYGAGDGVTARVDYRVNGTGLRVWTWPES